MSEPTLADIRIPLLKAYRNIELPFPSIRPIVATNLERYEDRLKDNSEYWLLLALGLEICFPGKSAEHQWRRARTCPDRTPQLLEEYAGYRAEILSARASRAESDRKVRSAYQSIALLALEQQGGEVD